MRGDRLSGQRRSGARRRRDDRNASDPNATVNLIIAAVVTVVLVAMAVWFFVFAGSPLAPYN